MSSHQPGSKPVDPDFSDIKEVRKRDMPGNPLGSDDPKPVDESPADADKSGQQPV